jgi:hypothetical protein
LEYEGDVLEVEQEVELSLGPLMTMDLPDDFEDAGETAGAGAGAGGGTLNDLLMERALRCVVLRLCVWHMSVAHVCVYVCVCVCMLWTWY